MNEMTANYNYLVNYNNYGNFVELVQTGFTTLYTRNITNENLDDYFFSMLNIFRDGIENPIVHNMKIEVVFTDNEHVVLTAFDLFFNLIFWKLPLSAGDELTSEFLFFEENITRKSIKRYIDDKFLDKHRTDISNITLNQCIDDAIYKFKYIDEFSSYLLNTINNEDTIELMNQNPLFYDCLHSDLSNVPLEDVKNVGMDITNQAIECIKNSGHCLADSFKAEEGINPKQFKEVIINVGSKPDGNGGVFNGIINSSLSNGGLQTVEDNFMDASVARIAEILKKNNVGDSGHFSRLLGLNNQDTRLHPDPMYVCNTKHFQKVIIKSNRMLDMFKNRWYKFRPDGVEYNMGPNPVREHPELVGQTLYFRSPMKCASHTHGKGICYRCYGNLAYTNADINIGKLAAEILCAILTQMLLSAKHLLESKVVALRWTSIFEDLFELTYNIVTLKDGLENLKKYKLIISNIEQESDNDNFEYNDYITGFEVSTPSGNYIVHTEKFDNIYLSNELKEVLEKHDEIDGHYIVSFDNLKDINIFLVKISNDELSKTLEEVKHMIDRIADITDKDADQWLQDFIETVIEGGINIDSVHCEVMLSNQIRNADDILDTPYWQYANEGYTLLTLTQALTNHPNISTSLEYQKLPKTLYNPISFAKSAPAALDLFFMQRPQDEMDIVIEDPEIKSDNDSAIPLMKRIVK